MNGCRNEDSLPFPGLSLQDLAAGSLAGAIPRSFWGRTPDERVLEEVRAVRRDMVRLAAALGDGYVKTKGGLWVTPADYLEGES